MQRVPLTLIASFALLAFTAPAADAQVSSSALNQWTLSATMNAPRAQACSAILQDGSVLVTGGLGPAGPVNTAEVYGTNGAFTTIASMNQARANAACATLLDGRVLVTGGDDGTGALTTAEIYDPVQHTWTVTGSMTAPREGHQVAVNAWGGVWVAGGKNASGIAGTLEEYRVVPGNFRTVGTLTTPRTNFAMVSLPKHQVMVAGGTNGSSTIASVEIYNGNMGTLSVAGSLAQARQDFAAAALPDGTVLVTGGHDPNGNLLNSTEIFDPAAGVSIAGPNLITPRAFHSAYGLTNNGQVVIAGGIGSSGVLSSTETYAPWTGAIQKSASLNVSRRDNVSAFLTPGNLLVAGGRNDSGSLNSTELFQYVTIGTDQSDYHPGTPVAISGTGWQPGEQVSVQIVTVPLDKHNIEFTGSGTADGNGNVTIAGFAVDKSHLNMKFVITATGSQFTAQTSFTDGPNTPTVTFSYNPASGTQTAGFSNLEVTVSFSGGFGTPTGSFVPCLPDGCNVNGDTSPGTGNTCTVTGPNNDIYTLPGTGSDQCVFQVNSVSAGQTQVGVSYSGDSNYALGTYNDPNGPYVVQSPTSTVMTSGPTGNQPYGVTTPYVATVTVVSTNTPSGQVQFNVSGGAIGALTTFGSPVSLVKVNSTTYTATFTPTTPLAVSGTPYLISAVFLGDAADNSSNSLSSGSPTISTTIQTVNTTTTVNYSANPIVYGQALTINGTVTPTSGGGTVNSGTVAISGLGGAGGCASANVTAGAYSCTVTPPGPGTATYGSVTATYTPSGTGYNSSTGSGASFTVNQASTTTSAPVVTANTAGSNVYTFSSTATAVSPSTAAVNAGNISFYYYSGAGASTTNCGTTGTFLVTGAVNGSGVASSGAVTVPNGGVPTGPYTICAVYTGSTNFSASTSGGLNITSPSAGVPTTLQAPTGGPGTFGSPVTITGTITANSGGTFPTGTLTFFDCGSSSCAGTGSQIGSPATLAQGGGGATQGTASISPSTLTAGSHYVYTAFTSNNGAFAAPSPNYSATTLVTINKASATFTITSGAPSPVTANSTIPAGSSVTLIATYNGANATLPSGSVNFINTVSGNAIVCATSTLTSGVATCTVVASAANNLPGSNPAAQLATISVTYTGDSNYSSTVGAVTPFSFSVAKATTTTTLTPSANPVTVGGATVTLTATVTPTTSIAPTGTVTFSSTNANAPLNQSPAGCLAASPTAVAVTFNGANYVATCSFTPSGPGSANPGTALNYTAVYAGDSNTVTSTGNTSLSSIAATSATTLSAALSSAPGTPISTETVGNTVILTASITPIAGIPASGNFTFTYLSGNLPLAQSPSGCLSGIAVSASSAGVATCQFEFAGPGASSVTYKAVYANDPNYLTSNNTRTLSTLQFTASQPASTNLTAAVSSVTVSTETVGNVVTLTASITALSNIPAAAGGQFTFSYAGSNIVLPPAATQSPAGCIAPGGGTPVTIGAAVGQVYSATCTFEFAGSTTTPLTSPIVYTATYGNDPNYLATPTDSLTSAAAAVSNSLSASSSSAGTAIVSETVGNIVYLTAQLSGLQANVIPNGSFTFSYLPATPMGSMAPTTGTPTPLNTPFCFSGALAVANVAGTYQATCYYVFRGPGSSSITYSAAYASDPNYTSSTPAATTLTTVSAAVNNSLTASSTSGGTAISSETVGNLVYLTAQLTNPLANVTPTGSFTFTYLPATPVGSMAPTTGAPTPSNTPFCFSGAVAVNASGVATCYYEFRGPGSSSITYSAAYGSDPNYTSSGPSPTTLTTVSATVNDSLTASSTAGGTVISSETVGNIVYLTAQLTNPIANVTPTGSFTFTYLPATPVGSMLPTTGTPTPSNTPFCFSGAVAVNASGIATCYYEFRGPGASSVTYSAAYASDPNYTSSGSAATTLTTLSATVTNTLTASLSSAGTAISSETVGNIVYLTAALTNPVSNVTPTGSFTFTYLPATPMGSMLPTTGTPTPSNTPFCFSGAVAVNSSGVATCYYEFRGPGASSITYSAAYASDPNYTSSGAGTTTLSTTSVSVTSAVSASSSSTGTPTISSETVGNTVYLTAVLTNPLSTVTPTGSFTFTYLPATPVGSSPPTSAVTPAPSNTPFCFSGALAVANVGGNYQVTCYYEFRGPGSSSVTYSASYGSDPNYTSAGVAATTLSTSSATTQTVLTASYSSTGTPTINSEIVGQLVYLTATVTSPSVANLTPTGTVTFSLGGGNFSIGTSTCGSPVAISSVTGIATCSFEYAGPTSPTNNANTPPAITYSATYNADANFLTSSGTKQLSTTSASTTTMVTASSTYSPLATLGTVVTLTAVVTEAPPMNPGSVNPAVPFVGSFTFNLFTTGTGAAAVNATTPNVVNNTCLSPVFGSIVNNNYQATCSFEIIAAANESSTNPPTASNYTFTATYNTTGASDPNFLSSSNTTSALTVYKAPTGQVSATQQGSQAGTQPVITVTILSGGSPTLLPAPTGTVTVVGSGINVSGTLVPGSGQSVAMVTMPTLFAGTYPVTITYVPGSDLNYLPFGGVNTGAEQIPFTIIVGKTDTQTVVNFSSSLNLTVVNVQACSGAFGMSCGSLLSSVTPTGTVQIYANGAVGTQYSQNVNGCTASGGTLVASGSLTNGSFSTSLPSGSYIAVYSGDQTDYCSVSTPTIGTHVTPSTTMTLSSNPNPVPANQPAVLTATIAGVGASTLPTGTVTFTDNGIVIGTATISGGQASITTTLPGGTNTIVATYAGDNTFTGSSATLGLTVGKPPSTLTFSINPSNPAFGQSVTLTAKVTSSTQGGVAAPTGMIQFFDGSTLIGTANVVNGVATLIVPSLPAGVNNIVAVYSGDNNYGSFSGSVGTIVVNKGQITINVTVSTSNGEETVTASIAGVSGAAAPTGTVTFTDSVTGQILGTATVTNGSAFITFPVTTDPITAVYSGDGNYVSTTAGNVSAIAVVNGASYGTIFAPDEIVSLFGTALTTQTLSGSLPLPTTLGGITVTVTDSAGVMRTAVLFYVSPTQISFLIPAGTALGTATITVTTATGSYTETITVATTSAGLFTANASGIGPLAAQVVTTTPSGTQTYTNTATLSGTTFVNAPIVLTPAADTFYLLLYGTGFDQATVSTLTVTINGKTFTPTYVGPQGTYAGLDQINVLLPASLAGSGTVNVTITVNGTVSNTGTLAFQ